MTASAVQQLLTDARVPGLSMAVIGDGQGTALTAVGVRNAIDQTAVECVAKAFIYAPTDRPLICVLDWSVPGS